MGSIRKQDKLGALQHSGGNITLAPSILTIGGRQFETSSTLVVALPSLTANARYQVYAVLNAGVIELVISQNENSAGPTGYSAWKLVGSLYADGTGSPAFGSFINIEGIPETEWISYTPVTAGIGTPTSVNLFYRQRGNMMYIRGRLVTGTVSGSVPFTMSLPTGSNIDTNPVNTTADTDAFGQGHRQTNGVSRFLIEDSIPGILAAGYDGTNTDAVEWYRAGASSIYNSQTANGSIAAGDGFNITKLSIPVSNTVSNIPIKDL